MQDTHFYAEREDGKRFSVINIGKMMEDIPNKYDGMFLGWESIEMDSVGDLIHDNQERAESWEELKKILLKV